MILNNQAFLKNIDTYLQNLESNFKNILHNLKSLKNFTSLFQEKFQISNDFKNKTSFRLTIKTDSIFYLEYTIDFDITQSDLLDPKFSLNNNILFHSSIVFKDSLNNIYTHDQYGNDLNNHFNNWKEYLDTLCSIYFHKKLQNPFNENKFSSYREDCFKKNLLDNIINNYPDIWIGHYE